MLKKSLAAHIYSLLVSTNDMAPTILKHVVDNYLPHGSGFDADLKVELVPAVRAFTISFDYHHMDYIGSYTHWSQGVITVTHDFGGIELDLVTTEDDESFKDYVLDTFYQALAEELRIPSPFGEAFQVWSYRKAQLSLLLYKQPNLQVKIKLWREGDSSWRGLETNVLNITAEEAAAIAQLLIGRD